MYVAKFKCNLLGNFRLAAMPLHQSAAKQREGKERTSMWNWCPAALWQISMGTTPWLLLRYPPDYVDCVDFSRLEPLARTTQIDTQTLPVATSPLPAATLRYPQRQKQR